MGVLSWIVLGLLVGALAKWIMLTQVTDAEFFAADDFAAIELFIAKQDTQQGRLARAIAADEPDLGVIDNGRLGIIQQNLVAKTLVSVSNLKQRCH